MPTDPIVITVRPNGPLKIRGPAVVQRSDGKILSQEANVALCRCGQSSTKPFCDGTHKTIPFQAE